MAGLRNANMVAKSNRYLDAEVLAEEALANPTLLSTKIPILVNQLADAIECIKKVAPDKYFEHYIHLHKLLNGYHFNEDLYEYATSLMVNVDGTTGAKLSIEALRENAKKYGLMPTTLANEWDNFYIVSMYLSDNWDKTICEEENIVFAFKAAKGFLMDPDAPQHPGRALLFFTKIAMWNPENL